METRIKLFEQAILEAHETQIKLVRLEVKRMKIVSRTIAITAVIIAFVLAL